MKKILVLLALSLALASCNNSPNTSSTALTENNTIKVSASIAPISSIINYVADNTVSVHTVVPVGASPHTFELKPSDMIAIGDSKAVFTVGLGLDSFLLNALDGKYNVDLSTSIQARNAMTIDEDEKDKAIGVGEKSPFGLDPHMWLSINNAEIIADRVKEELIKLNPSKVDLYKANSAKFTQELETIKSGFADFKKGKTPQNYIVFHDAYNYLFADMGMDLNKKFVFEETPGIEPSTQAFKKLIDEIKKNNIKIIFKEPQLSSKSVEVLEKDYGLTVLQLNPLGNSDDKDEYIKNLKQNLESLKKIYDLGTKL
ncbi:MAG: metal ABC transporter substrate-binding protein [Candidatus Gracilibacteria bacterium]|nr:metal ABC transporter substrate-binding protein [Candidatus Gracilibacteria bacterium]